MRKMIRFFLIVTLLGLPMLLHASLSPASADQMATKLDYELQYQQLLDEIGSEAFDLMLNERDWEPVGADLAPNTDPSGLYAWTDNFVPKNTNAFDQVDYESSTTCGGGVYVYWWGIPASSLGNLGVWSYNIPNQLHINSYGGLNGHKDCHANNRCDIRVCAKAGFPIFFPIVTILYY